MRSLRRSVAAALDRATLASLGVEANDGIIATAGVVEGFAGAGMTGTPLVVAAVTSMIAGGVALGGARYAEEAAARESRLAVIAEEQRQLALSPEEELAELTALYEAKGLSRALAAQVATQLTAMDPLAAHLEAEHRLSLHDDPLGPVLIAVGAGLAFALGAAIPLLSVLLAPDDWRGSVTFVASLAALVLTSVVMARLGRSSPTRIAARAVGVALVAMVLSLLVGWLIQH